MRKTLICLASVLCVGLLTHVPEAQARMYTCVRPDGTAVCTVTTDESDPSVVCNHECLDCNMVCAAKAYTLREGGQTMTSPAQPMPGRQTPQARPGTVETAEVCRQQYERCVNACRSNPNNVSGYDLDACLSSCESARSGCGRKP